MNMKIDVQYNSKTDMYEVVQWQESPEGQSGGVLASFKLLQEAVEYMETGK